MAARIVSAIAFALRIAYPSRYRRQTRTESVELRTIRAAFDGGKDCIGERFRLRIAYPSRYRRQTRTESVELRTIRAAFDGGKDCIGERFRFVSLILPAIAAKPRPRA